MMKEYLLIGLLFISTATIQDVKNPGDTTAIMFEDTLVSAVDLNDSVESSFDENLDSMMNMYEVEQQVSVDSGLSVNETTNLPDFPDSVYMQRLASIPTVVNLSYNPIVKRYIDVYSKKKRQIVEVMLGLSQYYFPIFDDIFDSYDVPNEMKYMSIIESALNPRACSRTRAVGLWQFMYGTGRLYGLEVNSVVDERLDPIKSTYAAAKYVKDLYDVYKDWILVIAAYNCGPGNVNKAIRRSGGKRNYWEIYYYLPRETRGHVPAFIAATYIMNYYKEHNLTPASVDMSQACDTLHINKQLHLQQVSDILGIPLQQLRDLNPQYRRDIIPAFNKTYSLCIPVDRVNDFIDCENSIFHYKDSVFFNPARLALSPTSKSHVYFIPEAPGPDYIKIAYTVKTGDNLGLISSWYDVSISDLRYWNDIHRNVIRSGQKLHIYKLKSKADRYKDIDNLPLDQKQAMIGRPATVLQVTAAAPINNYTGEYIMYTVKYGDSLWDIAKKFPGVTDNDIMQLNNIKNVSMIKPGQQLKIKPKI
jgi:membrane-bound lytic murein transglycosylase D